jgi:uncharacterized circularly permuted ATP-grasp superfamily protein/uncharacterized alpha-E superfamily protein
VTEPLADPEGADAADRILEPTLFGDADALGYGLTPVYDEMVTGNGRLRPHWRPLIGQLAPLDPADMTERGDETRRLLRQNGVTYAVYGDAHGAERLWPLDLIPLLISSDEWTRIEAGAVQRAQLLNAILADLYGPQRLLAEGRVKPGLVSANPGFLRPCHGIEPAGGIFLHLVAFDLARGSDGRWRVMADRTQAASGAGFTLENRSVIGRVLADCLSDSQARPLAPFFEGFRDSLDRLVPEKLTENDEPTPRTVLLTPGPYNETYFEHVFLARQLGITLVEGADLTVRGRRVYLKTLSALEPVGVILRRLDDSFSDPLELRPDSTLGIVGLTEAVRAGNVSIANALGTGMLESMAFKPYMTDLSAHLLGEELILPDVATWWCGEADSRRHVLDHLDTLVIKPAFRSLGAEAMFGSELTPGQRRALGARIAARPEEFVGQERLSLSVAPTWDGGRLQPRPLVLRVFVAATPSGFTALPGGLTRTAPPDGTPNVSMQRGSLAKDTWVVGPVERAEQVAGIEREAHAVARPGRAAELSSRAADGLFWVGRYAERTEGLVRLLRTLLAGLTDAAQPWGMRDIEPLLNLAVWQQLIPQAEGTGRGTAARLIPIVQAPLVDPNHPSGIVANLERLLRAARGVRDRLPPDCWRVVSQLDRQTAPTSPRMAPARMLLRLDELVMLFSALTGASEETMPRDAGWRFLEIGRRLERAIALVQVARGMASPPPMEGVKLRRVDERRLLTAMLALVGVRASGVERADGSLDCLSTLKAVFASGGDPRSLAFQLRALADHLSALPRSGTADAPVERAISLVAEARLMIGQAIIRACSGSSNAGAAYASGEAMRAAFADLDDVLPQISSLLADAYFTHDAS